MPIRKKDKKTAQEKSRPMSDSSKRKIGAWICFGTAGLMTALLLLYIFVWSQPVQPDAPEEMMMVAAPTAEPSETPTQTSVKTSEPEPTYKPMVMQESFEELYEQNNDIVGWIHLEGTTIDYPVMQTENNEDYMDHDFNGDEHSAGSLFFDFRCDYTNMFEAAHHIIYGHNMKNGSMFHDLTQYEDETFFEEHPYISLNTLYGNYTFEVFAVYETPISFYYLETDFSSRESWLDFIEVFQEKSMHESDVVLTEDDVVLTMSTCTNSHVSSIRFVVNARLVNPERYDTEYSLMY